MSSLIGAILNSRGSFGAPMWTPIVNNFVVIAVLGLYIAMDGQSKDPRTISGAERCAARLGTTLGIVVQTVALVPAIAASRLPLASPAGLPPRRGSRDRPDGRLDVRLHRGDPGGILVTTKLAGDTNDGITEYNYAWLLFQLPYAVVGISVITALLPRMSAHASQRRFGLVRQDFSGGRPAGGDHRGAVLPGAGRAGP